MPVPLSNDGCFRISVFQGLNLQAALSLNEELVMAKLLPTELEKLEAVLRCKEADAAGQRAEAAEQEAKTSNEESKRRLSELCRSNAESEEEYGRMKEAAEAPGGTWRNAINVTPRIVLGINYRIARRVPRERYGGKVRHGGGEKYSSFSMKAEYERGRINAK